MKRAIGYMGAALLIAAMPLTEIKAQQVLPPVKLTIYRAGFAHLVRQGNLTFKNNYAQMDLRMMPLVGTFWLSGEKNYSLTVQKDTVKVSRKADNFEDLLAANLGKTVSLTYQPSATSDKTIDLTGKIEDYYRTTGMLKLNVKDKGTSYLNVRKVQLLNLEFDGSEATRLKTDSVFRIARVYSDKNTASQEVELHYATAGIQWQPSYYLKLSSAKKGRMEMKAVIQNNTESIQQVETDVVIGQPLLTYGFQADPLLGGGFPQNVQPYYYNPRQNEMIDYASAPRIQSTEGSRHFSGNYNTSMDKNSTLYHYKLGKLTLPAHTQAYYPIFANELEYEHLYECNLNNHLIPDNFYRTSLRAAEYTASVMHRLRITNSTKYPLADGPMVVENSKHEMLAQVTLPYTPMGDKSEVSLAEAEDVVVKSSEEEIKLDKNAEYINGLKYARLTVKGTLTIENRQAEAITLDLKKSLLATEVKAEGAETRKIPTHAAPNTQHDIKWQLQLKPQDSRKIIYEYSVFVRVL